ncbi:hypothetical protein VaNZ11_002391 [Volvox africanus]|uniref:Protein kinase domain-containing protein n=1 Tax=Volvox africanus TaxID=51714 RepID=A0ABQ5RSU8_9CHLO|nr:hypothetical protein VaNZ11_002391 [Volvox africanus]
MGHLCTPVEGHRHVYPKILHRDIKPDNILVTKEGVLKLCDFGFARYTSCGPRYVQHGTQYITTRWYRSPEALMGDIHGPSSDIWSVGCTTAEIATGKPLFPGNSTADQIWRIVRCLGKVPTHQAALVASNRTLHSLAITSTQGQSMLRHHLPADLDPHLFRLVESCLQLDLMQRPTAQEVLQWPYFGGVGRCLSEAAQRYLTAAAGGSDRRCGNTGGGFKMLPCTHVVTVAPPSPCHNHQQASDDATIVAAPVAAPVMPLCCGRAAVIDDKLQVPADSQTSSATSVPPGATASQPWLWWMLCRLVPSSSSLSTTVHC